MGSPQFHPIPFLSSPLCFCIPTATILNVNTPLQVIPFHPSFRGMPISFSRFRTHPIILCLVAMPLIMSLRVMGSIPMMLMSSRKLRAMPTCSKCLEFSPTHRHPDCPVTSGSKCPLKSSLQGTNSQPLKSPTSLEPVTLEQPPSHHLDHGNQADHPTNLLKILLLFLIVNSIHVKSLLMTACLINLCPFNVTKPLMRTPRHLLFHPDPFHLWKNFWLVPRNGSSHPLMSHVSHLHPSSNQATVPPCNQME